MKIGYVGLGKMGKNMVIRLLEHGHEIVAFNRSPEPMREVMAAGAVVASDIKNLVEKLEHPKIVWLMLPAGEVTNSHVEQLVEQLGVGDVLVDGANSYFRDTLKNRELCEAKGIRFIDCGVSGGPDGARNGACLLVGGDVSDVALIEPVLISASGSSGWHHLGKCGAGHFAKMVHNGIEYGMMQAIGEGAMVLKYSEFGIDVKKAFVAYQHGSVIASRLVDWTVSALTEHGEELGNVNAQIVASGEGEWTVKTAKEAKMAVPVIEAALEVRRNSKNVESKSPVEFRNKVVSALRGQFGKHAVTT